LKALLIVAALAGAAHADGKTGVVVTGESKLQAPLSAAIGGWLRAHNRETMDGPLDPDAINTIVDCFVIEDFACARNIIDRRAKSESIVFARVEVAKRGGGSRDDIAVSAYWFVKGHDAVVERRVCERCTNAALKETAETMLRTLAAATDNQRPDGETRPAPPPVAPPKPVAKPRPAPVVVAPPSPQPPPPSVIEPSPEHHRSRALPIAVGVAGVVAVVAAIPLLMHDDDGSAPTYRDTKPAGVVVGLAGLALIGVDVWLWKRGSKQEGPTVAATSHGAVIGWMGRF